MKTKVKALSMIMAATTTIGIGLNLGMGVYACQRASIIDRELVSAMNTDCFESEKLSTVVLIDDIDFAQHSDILKLRERILSSNNMNDEIVQNAIMEYRASCADLYADYNSKYVQDCLNGYDIEYVSHYFPAVYMNLSEEEVYEISLNSDVRAISLNEYEPLEASEMKKLL